MISKFFLNLAQRRLWRSLAQKFGPECEFVEFIDGLNFMIFSDFFRISRISSEFLGISDFFFDFPIFYFIGLNKKAQIVIFLVIRTRRSGFAKKLSAMTRRDLFVAFWVR